MKNILITGLPGAGKTTLIRRLSEIFKEFNPAGFFTAEIVEGGVRTGFSVAPLFGDSRIFAHLNLKSKHKLGKYYVDIRSFDNLLASTFSRDRKTGLYLIDEIGKMEGMSRVFSKLVIEFLDSEKPFVATTAEKGIAIVSDIRRRDDVKIIDITPLNRDQKLKELTMEIRDLLLE